MFYLPKSSSISFLRFCTHFMLAFHLISCLVTLHSFSLPQLLHLKSHYHIVIFFSKLLIGIVVNNVSISTFSSCCKIVLCHSVIGAVVICLFPLWPEQMREYTWYLSVGAAILLGVLIFVALCKFHTFLGHYLLELVHSLLCYCLFSW